MVDEFLSESRATLDPPFCPQIPREMFQIGGLIVFYGLLAQTTALLDTLPLPLDTLPLPLDPTVILEGTPAQALNPTDLAGSLTDGK